MSAVMQKIKGAGIPPEAVQTAAYDLQPEFDYANNRQTLRGYVARNTIEVRVDELPKLGDVIDIVVGAGATNVSGVRFDLKDRAAAEREALSMAVADARQRADAAAAGAGMKVERVLKIEEQRSIGMPPPRPMMSDARGEAQEARSTPVAPGEIEIRAAVTLTAADPLKSRFTSFTITPSTGSSSNRPMSSGAPIGRAVWSIGVELRQLFGRGDPVVFQPPRGDEHPALERADGAVVGVDRSRQPARDFLEVHRHHADAIVELPSEVADLLRVLRDVLLLPAVGDGAQQRHQRQRAREHDAACQAELEQRGIALQRRAQQRLARART